MDKVNKQTKRNPNLDENNLDIRHISIIDALPTYKTKKEVLTVGCGDCRKDIYLKSLGFDVTSTDYFAESKKYDFDKKMKNLKITNIEIRNTNILDIKTFPKKQYESVICAEVLEHLFDYKIALQNLIELTENRLIITVPWQFSFNDTSPPPKGHCNFWSDFATPKFKNINEFKEMCKPYATSIQKIRTKQKDVHMNQYSYLIIVDKKQMWNI